MPSPLPPTSERLERHGLFLIEDGQTIFLWVGRDAVPQLIIDVFNGDPIPLNRPADFDFMSWLSKGSDGNNPHTKEQVDPIVDLAIKHLKEEKGIKKLGAVGYCFGAKVRICPPDSSIHPPLPAHSLS